MENLSSVNINDLDAGSEKKEQFDGRSLDEIVAEEDELRAAAMKPLEELSEEDIKNGKGQSDTVIRWGLLDVGREDGDDGLPEEEREKLFARLEDEESVVDENILHLRSIYQREQYQGFLVERLASWGMIIKEQDLERIDRIADRQNLPDAEETDIDRVAVERAKNAEYQQRFKDKRRLEYHEWVKTVPAELQDILINGFKTAQEAMYLLTQPNYSNNFLFVGGQGDNGGLHVANEDGLWMLMDSEEGRIRLTEIMKSARKDIIAKIKAIREQERIRPFVYEKLNESIEGWRIKNVVESIAGNLGELPNSQRIESGHFNMKRIVEFRNGVYDLRKKEFLIEGVRELHNKKQISQGFAAPSVQKLLYNPKITQVKDLIDHFGERPYQMILETITEGGKLANVFYEPEPDGGKSTLVKNFEEGTKQVSNMLCKHATTTANFDNLLIACTKYLLVTIEEADKPAKIPVSAFTETLGSGGESTMDEKFKPLQRGYAKAPIILFTGGPVNLDWDAQGIVADEDGKGGRFKGLVQGRGIRMDGELGKFWNDNARYEERKEALDDLWTWIISLPPREDHEQCFYALQSFVYETSPDWKKAILDSYQSGDSTNDYINSKSVVDLINKICGDSKKPDAKEVGTFMYRKFKAVSKTKREGKDVFRAWVNLKELEDKE